MPADRGEYRSIPRVILDGKDYQDLPPEARHLFLVLKIGMGPAGIEVHYPDAHAIELAAQTGYTVDQVGQILALLERSGWIRRERNVFWIVDQLRYEPSLSERNGKHRKSVLTHIQGLPKLGIVGAFLDHYQGWIDGYETLKRGYPKLQDTHSIAFPKAQELQKTKDRIQKTEDVVGSAPPPPPDGVSVTQWERVWFGVPAPYRPDLEGFVRAARHPSAVVSEIEAAHTGLTPPGYSWDVVGKALRDLAVAGVELTSFRLASFCRGAITQPPTDAQSSDSDEGEFVRAARELERERELAARSAS